MEIVTKINGIDLKNDFKIVTISLVNVVIYDLIEFTAKIHIEKNLQEFERKQENVLQVINKNGSTDDYDINVIYEIIEETKNRWIENIKSLN